MSKRSRSPCTHSTIHVLLSLDYISHIKLFFQQYAWHTCQSHRAGCRFLLFHFLSDSIVCMSCSVHTVLKQHKLSREAYITRSIDLQTCTELSTFSYNYVQLYFKCSKCSYISLSMCL